MQGIIVEPKLRWGVIAPDEIGWLVDFLSK
jgi:hypothetical protein